jgi:23S rRNA G2445 N2-methylase RlmL
MPVTTLGMTCFSGLAPQVLEEALGLGYKARLVGPALVVVDETGADPDAARRLHELRTPTLVLQDVIWGEISQDSLACAFADLSIFDEFLAKMRDADLQRLVGSLESFAVRVSRTSDVRISTEIAARELGSLIRIGAESEGRSRPRVDLQSPDVEIVAGLQARSWYVGRKYRPQSLSLGSRPSSVEISSGESPESTHPASISSSLAACIVRLSSVFMAGGSLLDPFCGSGTILEEACMARFQDSKRHPNAGLQRFSRSIWGVDASESAIQAAKSRLKQWNCHLMLGNARKLDGFEPGQVDAVVTNPPWGQRLGSSRGVERTYRRFAEELMRLCVKEVVCLSAKKSAWIESMERAGWATPSVHHLNYGKMPLWVFIHRR